MPALRVVTGEQALELAIGAAPPATRQAALSVSRWEARTSDTRSPSADLTAAITAASSTAADLASVSAWLLIRPSAPG